MPSTANATRLKSPGFGTAFEADGSVRFNLWAPGVSQVDLVLPETHQIIPMLPDENQVYHHSLPGLAEGTLYQYQIEHDGTKLLVPDPASRFQPFDVHGPSCLMNPDHFNWEDKEWHGRPWEETVIYELHVGSFTPEGTFNALIGKLDYFVDLGVTAIELMPIADFPGARNWGYDGVLLFAPDSRYGHPDDLKRLIQAAHQKGLMVFLDVVYNHFGPDGNYLHTYAKKFFTEKHHTPWGAAINFDDTGSEIVRSFYVQNALYWLEEFHFDGLRFDAVHAIVDHSKQHILEEISEAIHSQFGKQRHIHLMLENDDNTAHYLKTASNGVAEQYTAQWNDDIHHALHVLTSGEESGYYADYSDKPAKHLARCLTEGFAYQGETSAHRNGEKRGENSSHLPLTRFVSFIQNHDQVGNRAFGDRLIAFSKNEKVRISVAIYLLSPQIPMLFMGEEWASDKPFPFFCDFNEELGKAVTKGRREEFSKFPEFSDEKKQERIPDPCAPETFQSAVLNWDVLQKSEKQYWWQYYRELLSIRKNSIMPILKQSAGYFETQYEVLKPNVLSVQWKTAKKGVSTESSTLTLIANFSDETLDCIPAHPGKVLFQTAPEISEQLENGKLPALSAIWYLG